MAVADENQILKGSAIDIVPTLASRSVDLIVTDPPYGDNKGYGPQHRVIAGNENPLLGLLVISQCYRVLKFNATAYMFSGMQHLDISRQFIARYTRYRIRDVLIWDKVHMNVGMGFRKQYECVLVLEKGKPRYRNTRMLNILRSKKVSGKAHPHAKPVDLIREFIEHSSDRGNLVFDPFIGSGTTAVGALQSGRRYLGIECDPQYYALAKERISLAQRELRLSSLGSTTSSGDTIPKTVNANGKKRPLPAPQVS